MDCLTIDSIPSPTIIKQTNNYCECGCGNIIPSNPHHKYYGFPKFIHGHNSKGILRSPDWCHNISKTKTGKKLPSMSLAKMGKHYPNLSAALKGRRRLARDEQSRREKISASCKQNGIGRWMRGRHLLPITRDKIGEASKLHWLNQEYRAAQSSYRSTEQGKANLRKGALVACAQLKSLRYYNTKPELNMERILNTLGFSFRHPYIVSDIRHCYLADFYIPISNLIIEVDGKYWHNYPNRRPIDKIRDKELEEAGYNLIRFWEDEISETVVKCKLPNINEPSQTLLSEM